MVLGLFLILAGIVFAPFIPVVGVPLFILGIIWLVLAALGSGADSIRGGVDKILESDEARVKNAPARELSEKQQKTMTVILVGLLGLGVLGAIIVNVAT